MLVINLDTVIKARNVQHPFSFLRKAGLSSHSATSILNHSIRIVQLNHIELICKAFFCRPNDILQWFPDKTGTDAPNHPLFDLVVHDTYAQWQQTLATIPLEQLKTIVSAIETKEKA